MEPLTFSHEIGIIAGIFLVLAYGLMNFGVLTTDSPIYQALNVLGALGFAYTAVSPFNPGLLLTEIVWVIVAVGFLWKIFTHKKKASNDVVDTEAVLVSVPAR
ncbi:CBU_0592 family membrane protein [Corynebacterium sp. A21]|uniref:CBU_0592 family membrane protein n=1 Tax=Corynebacterium sp. A21 TaxID=3457318 RepID=UPI003FD6A9AC